MPECPLCRNSRHNLDFHHWDYDKGIGVEICRDCHNRIHEGEEGRVSIQQNRAEYYGGDHWHERAVLQLIISDLRAGGIKQAGVEVGKINPYSGDGCWEEYASHSWETYSEFIEQRYNLPDGWRDTADAPWFNPWPSHFVVALNHGEI